VPRSLASAAVLLVPCLLYALGTRAFDWLALLESVSMWESQPYFVLLAGDRKGPGLFDLLAILALWLPFDLGLLGGIWSWPQPGGASFCQTYDLVVRIEPEPGDIAVKG
jgi:hypothetical protein